MEIDNREYEYTYELGGHGQYDWMRSNQCIIRGVQAFLIPPRGGFRLLSAPWIYGKKTAARYILSDILLTWPR
ncbi:MAG: hypothetical protein ACRD3W_07530, partial [Terriglobales bacterium]